jgi:hypothetical protein
LESLVATALYVRRLEEHTPPSTCDHAEPKALCVHHPTGQHDPLRFVPTGNKTSELMRDVGAPAEPTARQGPGWGLGGGLFFQQSGVPRATIGEGGQHHGPRAPRRRPEGLTTAGSPAIAIMPLPRSPRRLRGWRPGGGVALTARRSHAPDERIGTCVSVCPALMTSSRSAVAGSLQTVRNRAATPTQLPNAVKSKMSRPADSRAQIGPAHHSVARGSRKYLSAVAG